MSGKAYTPEELLFDIDTVESVSIPKAAFGPGGVGEYTVDVNCGSKSHTLTRSFTDFRHLVSQLNESGVGSSVKALPPPPPFPWFVQVKLALGVDPRDFDALEIHRAHLDDWLQSAMAVSAVKASTPFSNFLAPSLRRDWPDMTGDIDLAIHDMPHQTAITEWWYWNMHFTAEDGRKFSAYFACFQRIKYHEALSGEKKVGFAVHAALCDVSGQQYYARSILDIDAPGIVKNYMEKDPNMQKVLKRAYVEMMDKGELPLPDQLMDRELKFTTKTMDTTLLDCSMKKEADGTYVLSMTDLAGTSGYDVRIKPLKKPVRHGFNGVTRGHGGDHMFYYFVPRCSIEGTVRVEGKDPVKIASGSAWYDHEFGGSQSKAEEDAGAQMLPYAWCWCAVQLDTNQEISVCYLKDMLKPDEKGDMFGKLIHSDGKVDSIEEAVIFEPAPDAKIFTSLRTYQKYPLKYILKNEAYGIDLVMEAAIEDQELISIINMPGYWEGRLNVTGTINGKPVTGNAFVERAGFEPLRSLKQFFKRVGESVLDKVHSVFPDKFTPDTMIDVVARPGYERYLEGIPPEILHDTVVKPVRAITDRGGKSWRSFAALACIDAVGGDSRKFADMLAMPEFVHVGSLIVDDIQDESELRRGGPAAHKMFGEPMAINAGTNCYFQSEKALRTSARKYLTPEDLLECYNEFFLCMRAGHAGQALDIHGLDYLMEDVLERQDAALAEERVLTIHRLKTAVPAGTLSRMGAIMGGATLEQKEAVGLYFEGIGVAFQIMDDVLNLRGLTTNEADRKAGVTLKTLGEDITDGKVTIPVAKAIGLLPKDEMRALWNTIKSKPTDTAVVQECIDKLEACGAVDACVEQAVSMVETSWAQMDPLLPPSFHKCMLRCFGWFVTDRASV